VSLAILRGFNPRLAYLGVALLSVDKRDIHAVRWGEWRSSSSVEIATEAIGSALNAMDDAGPLRESEHAVLSSRMAHRTARKNLAFIRSVFVDHGMRQSMVPFAA
jgi:hypothetical protein